MPGAIVIINTDIGCESQVLEELVRMSEVESAYIVYGVYDIVAKVNAVDLDALEELVSDRVRRIKGIRSTLTLVINREHRKG
jgi:DNA-binding Lrp family transcriptional regulator